MKSEINEDQYCELNIQKKMKGKSCDFSERDFTHFVAYRQKNCST